MTEKLPCDIAKLPGHVAIIMDGNRRWADKRDIPRLHGHEAGLENLRRIAGNLNDYSIKYATVYTFSTENWQRPRDEVDGLMYLLEEKLDAFAAGFDSGNIRLRHLGSLAGLAESVTKRIYNAVELTKNNTGLTLNLAFNYGGRAEIVNTVRLLIREGVPADKIDEKMFGEHLYTNGIPDVDLLIRTGGELRTSNFLLWQSAYAEFYFSDVLWPDFDKSELDRALLAFNNRQRRFGRL